MIPVVRSTSMTFVSTFIVLTGGSLISFILCTAYAPRTAWETFLLNPLHEGIAFVHPYSLRRPEDYGILPMFMLLKSSQDVAGRRVKFATTVAMRLPGAVASIVLAGKFLGAISWSWTWILWTLFPILLTLLTVIAVTKVVVEKNRFVLISVAVLWFVLIAAYCAFGTLMIQENQQKLILDSPNSVETRAVVSAVTFKGFMNYQGVFSLTLQVMPQDGKPFVAKTMVMGDGSSMKSPYSVGTTIVVKYDPSTLGVAVVSSGS